MDDRSSTAARRSEPIDACFGEWASRATVPPNEWSSRRGAPSIRHGVSSHDRLAFAWIAADHGDIFRFEAGRPAQAVLASPLQDNVPSFSPDGRRIAFESDAVGRRAGDLAGRRRRLEPRAAHAWAWAVAGHPRFSPDGRQHRVRVQGRGRVRRRLDHRRRTADPLAESPKADITTASRAGLATAASSTTGTTGPTAGISAASPLRAERRNESLTRAGSWPASPPTADGSSTRSATPTSPLSRPRVAERSRASGRRLRAEAAAWTTVPTASTTSAAARWVKRRRPSIGSIRRRAGAGSSGRPSRRHGPHPGSRRITRRKDDPLLPGGGSRAPT